MLESKDSLNLLNIFFNNLPELYLAFLSSNAIIYSFENTDNKWWTIVVLTFGSSETDTPKYFNFLSTLLSSSISSFKISGIESLILLVLLIIPILF